MNRPTSDAVFAGSVPQMYEQYMVPLIFATYAADLARRVALLQPSRVLEIAAGTGVVTRELARTLPAAVSIVATDLNQPMLDFAQGVGTQRAVEWRQADAMQLPFADASFDVVACEFGVMFFPDKAKAFSEARRVLRPGGTFLFSAWDSIVENEFAEVVTQALAAVFPAAPPRFMARVPHGYHDPAVIARDLASGGFAAAPQVTTLAARSRADSPRIVAVAYCQGTPLRGEIEAQGGTSLGAATDIAADAIARRFGSGPVDGKIQAHVLAVTRTD